jgi:hypothetical protein
LTNKLALEILAVERVGPRELGLLADRVDGLLVQHVVLAEVGDVRHNLEAHLLR